MFFHTSTLIRRRHNRILGLQSNEGEWCEEPKNLKQMVREFYMKLYTKEPYKACSYTEWEFLGLQ